MRLPGLPARLGTICFAAIFFASAELATAQNPDLGLDRVADTASFAERTALPGHRPAWAVPAADRGTLPDTLKVQLTFALSRAPEVQTAFEQLLAAQQNPSSPRYHQWLTPQQVGAQFGPTQHDLDALITWLTGQGFSIDAVTPSRIFVQVSAPAAVIGAALGTSLHTFQVGYGSTTDRMQAPTAEPTLPAALAPVVSFIGGLSSVPVHTHSRVEVHTAPATQQVQGRASAAGVHPDLTASSTRHFLTPLDFNKIYDVPTDVTGTGQKVMIIGGSRLSPDDLSYFETDTALPAYTPNYIVDPAYGDPGQTLDGSQGEATLDFERVHGTAPGAQVDLVIAQNWLNGTVNQNLVLYAINTVNDPVMSLSFGACENLQPAGYVKQEDAMYSQAAAQGITTLVSSGDSGVTGCAEHGVAAATQTAYPNINDVCASSYVTCVGGTQFNDTINSASYWSAVNGAGFSSALSYIPEGAWNESINAGSNAAKLPYLVLGTGGGPSTVIAKPVWQTGTGVPADGVRDTPDLSFSASGHNGYFACLEYESSSAGDAGCVPNHGSIGFVVFSGTSASAPSMAGVVALLDAKLGTRQGNINPALYALAASTPAAFHDATIASSGVTSCLADTPSLCNNSTPTAASLTGGVAGYLLQTGYDLDTGLGSLDVNAFLTAASGPTLIATTNTLTATPTAIATNQTAIFKDVVSAATATTTTVPSGTVTFTLNSTGANLGVITLANGVAATGAVAFTTTGTFLVNVAYSGDTVFKASAGSISIVVSAPTLPATTTTLTGTTGTINAQTGATYTALVAPAAANTLAPGGSVQFIRTFTASGLAINLGAPVLLAAGKAVLSPTLIPSGAYSISVVYTGDTNFAASTSNTLALTVTAVPTTTTLAGLSTTVTSTTASNVTITVVAPGGGTVDPTGTVQLTVDTVNYGAPLPLAGTPAGFASTTRPTSLILAAGTHSVCAVYTGDTIYAASTSTCSTVVSTTTPVIIGLTPATASIYSYQTTPLVATITGISPTVAATSTVTFKDGGAVLATVTPAYAGPTGSYTYTAGPLSVGIHTLTATFDGDNTYAAAISNASSVTVALATVTLAPAAPSLTLIAGSSATDIITLTSLNFAGSENVTCVVTSGGGGSVGSLPGCTSSPSVVTFTGSGAATTLLTINSSRRSAATAPNFSLSTTTTLRGLASLSLCSLLALSIPRRRRKALRALQLALPALLLIVTLASLSGCGLNNFGSIPVPGTAPGLYTITVTAFGATNVSGSTTTSRSRSNNLQATCVVPIFRAQPKG